MNAQLCNSAVYPAIDLLKKKKAGDLKRSDVEALLDHEDYQFEFRRYEERVGQQEFVDYVLTFEHLGSEQIENMDLRNHHAYWLDLYQNLDWFERKARDFFEKFNHDVITEAFQIAVNGFPKHYKFNDCKIIFTCGIGQSFGYANENGMHFDIMQLFRHYENDHFKEMIAHEIHHLIFLDNIEFLEQDPEGYFLQWLAIEGLAVKFTNNAQGVISQKLHPNQPANTSLDSASFQYLNDHFESTYAEFKKTIRNIRNGQIKTAEDVRGLLVEYWFNLYADGQSKEEVPMLKQSRLYAMGNDLWGTIYDAYGMDKLYEILTHPDTFIESYNNALKLLHKEQYTLLI